MGAHRYMHLPARGAPAPSPLIRHRRRRGQHRHPRRSASPGTIYGSACTTSPPQVPHGKAVTGLPETRHHTRRREVQSHQAPPGLAHRLPHGHAPRNDRGEVVNELKKLFRNNGGWCNQTGWDSGDFKIAALCSGGATLVATVPGPEPTIVKGRGNQYLEVHAMDPTIPPPPVQTPSSTPQQLQDGMCFFPMTALDDGSNHFPNFGGRCLVPLLGKGGVQYVLWTNTVRPDGIGFQKVTHILQPALPERTDVTAGLIP